MSISMLTQKGQTTIPKDIRDFLDLHSNEQIVYVRDAGRVYIQAVKGNILDAAGAFKRPFRSGVDFKKVRQLTKGIIAKKIAKA